MPEHICADLGELQPQCDSAYCALEREAIELDAALAAGETALSPADQLVSDVSMILDYELAVR